MLKDPFDICFNPLSPILLSLKFKNWSELNLAWLKKNAPLGFIELLFKSKIRKYVKSKEVKYSISDASKLCFYKFNSVSNSGA